MKYLKKININEIKQDEKDQELKNYYENGTIYYEKLKDKEKTDNELNPKNWTVYK